jgi:hypothetical protein
MEEVLITEELLIKSGFKKLAGNTYRLKINLSYPGERFLEADLMPHNKWICYYQVNNIAACSVKHTFKELQELYLGITGFELK